MANSQDNPLLLKSGPSRLNIKSKTKVMGNIQKVRFYPSGMVPTDFSGRGIWVKLKKKQVNKPISVLGFNHNWLHLDCPDRELLIVNNGIYLDNDRPYGGGWDRFVSMSSVHATGNDMLHDRFLINPHAFGKIDLNMGMREPDKYGYSDMVVLEDSGGFQLRSGQKDWVDPVDLAEEYSSNADEGMLLDIPCGGMPKDMIKQCAHIQNANGDIMRQVTDPNVALSNVIHGVEISDMRFYRNIVEEYNADWPIVSFPSSMDLPPLKQLDRLALLLSTGAQYSQYHMLGLFNLGAMCLITRLAHKLSLSGREVFITADAATAYYSAKWRVYHVQATHYASIERHLIGQVAPVGQYANHNRILPCSCEICSAIKYTDVLAFLDHKVKGIRLIVRHNESNYVQWLAALNVYAATLTDFEYRELITNMMGTGLRAQLDAGLEYIEVLLTDGFTAAHNRFKHQTSMLFAPQTNELFSQDIQPTENVKATTKRLTEVIRRYNKYHGL